MECYKSAAYWILQGYYSGGLFLSHPSQSPSHPVTPPIDPALPLVYHRGLGRFHFLAPHGTELCCHFHGFLYRGRWVDVMSGGFPALGLGMAPFPRGGRKLILPSLKLTAKAPRNWCLEYDPFLLWDGLFSGAFAVSFRVYVNGWFFLGGWRWDLWLKVNVGGMIMG